MFVYETQWAMQPGSFEKAKEKQRVLLADSLNFRDQEKKKKEAEDQGGEWWSFFVDQTSLGRLTEDSSVKQDLDTVGGEPEELSVFLARRMEVPLMSRRWKSWAGSVIPCLKNFEGTVSEWWA